MNRAQKRTKTAPQQEALGLDLPGITESLRAGRQVRRTLQPWGRLHIDRALPFLCIYRRPGQDAHPQGEALVTTQASYLLAPGDAALASQVTHVVKTIAQVLVDDFGACLLIEVALAATEASAPSSQAPVFRLLTAADGEPAGAINELEADLSHVGVMDGDGSAARVEVRTRAAASDAVLPPSFKARDLPRGCLTLGLEVRPPHGGGQDGRHFPLAQRRLRRGLARALKRAAFEFTTRRTTQRPSHYHVFGRTKFLKAVSEADRRLAEVSNRFDFLLLSTPRNVDAGWLEFRRGRFKKAPSFSYPPLPFDPSLAKRELFDIRLEHIEDPTLEDLFREQQEELDRKITMLADRGTPRFRYGSLQLFGTVEDSLLEQATALLDGIPSRSREASAGGTLDAKAFGARAEEELSYLRSSGHPLPAKVHIRDDVSGLMVSRGHLLVPSTATFPLTRVDALLQHEVGTHVLTYYNGAAQSFRQLRNGLAGYEALQEGLAVLAEYLVGGLSQARLRLLAARVVATRRMIDGASFVEVFRELDRSFDLAQQTAYKVTMRIFRGGGLAKDAVYLRGLVALLAYLRDGGSLEPLLVGKIGLQHLELVQDLQARGVLVPARFRPRYLDQPGPAARLAALRTSGQVIDLVETKKRRTS